MDDGNNEISLLGCKCNIILCHILLTCLFSADLHPINMSQRAGSNKEVQAVTLNLKEQRLLEKTLGTLKLEEAYAVKLLALGNRFVRNLILRRRCQYQKSDVGIST